VGIAVGIACAGWLVLAMPGKLTRRAIAGASFAAAFACVVGAYLVIASTGQYSGLGDVNGSYLYARVAQFADCRFFTPPSRTRELCESTPPAQRPGTVFYQGQPGSPKLRVFPATQTDPQAADSQLGAFARAAILGEPKAYLRTVLSDYARYFETDPTPRPYSGSSWEVLTLGSSWTEEEKAVAARLRGRYPDVSTAPPRAAGMLLFYASVTQIRGGVLAALVLLGLLGAVIRSPQRRTAALGLLIFMVLTVVPVATLTYSQRYAVPGYGALGLAAAVGLRALLTRAGPKS
jgi:hypothetical protein